jgi:hypothetical protein
MVRCGSVETRALDHSSQSFLDSVSNPTLAKPLCGADLIATLDAVMVGQLKAI